MLCDKRNPVELKFKFNYIVMNGVIVMPIILGSIDKYIIYKIKNE